MENFNYKNININVDENGMFCFYFNKKFHSYSTLREAKSIINELTKEYYTFTDKDLKKMFSKLNDRERDFVKSLCNEIDIHCNNAYCQVGITEQNWDWDFDLRFDD